MLKFKHLKSQEEKREFNLGLLRECVPHGSVVLATLSPFDAIDHVVKEQGIDFSNLLLGKLTKRGKRGNAETALARLLDALRSRGYTAPLSVIYNCIEVIRPVVVFKTCKRKNKILHLPAVAPALSEYRLAVAKIAKAASLRKERTLAGRVAVVIDEIAQGKSELLKRKKEDQALAIQNLMLYRYMKKWKRPAR